jgi:DNA-binding IclR family transcriptional regulator
MPSAPSSMLAHIVAILDCFSTDRTELGVREVARQADLTTSTAGRLMADMKELGILQQNSATRTYSLGAKILAWSGVYLSSLDLRTIALPIMGDLRRLTSETVSLYLLDENERLCVERIESQHNVRMVARVGHRLPLYAGSAGKAILAFLPLERVDRILKSTVFEPFTSMTIVDPNVLKMDLDRIRLKGYAESHGEWILEASGVAAPILGQGGEVIGALSISGPGSRFTPMRVREYAAEVVRAAGQLSRSMGYILERNQPIGEIS